MHEHAQSKHDLVYHSPCTLADATTDIISIPWGVIHSLTHNHWPIQQSVVLSFHISSVSDAVWRLRLYILKVLSGCLYIAGLSRTLSRVLFTAYNLGPVH